MRGPINRVRDFSEAVGDRLVVDGGDLARRLGRAVRSPFERVAWTLQRWLIWPVQDRVPHPEGVSRVFAVGAVVAVAAGIGVAGLVLAASGGSGVAARTEAEVRVASVPKVTPPPKAPAAPTLQGAAPSFKPAKKGERPGAGSKQTEPAPPDSSSATETAGTSSSSAATDTISSRPSKQPTPSAQASDVAAAPAGPAAIAVARKFADAFVVYETGGVEPTVRDAFGETATLQLSRALLKRPPRLPANVDVPKAKVMNVVAGPARGGVYSVSVSLLRLGVTSELRLAMEQAKNRQWQVTDVLG